MSDVKFCKDCRHYRRDPNSSPLNNVDDCLRQRRMETDLVTGLVREVGVQLCRNERHPLFKDQNRCGPEAKFFELRDAQAAILAPAAGPASPSSAALDDQGSFP